MKSFDWGFVWTPHLAGWFRLWGWGLAYKSWRAKKLFSERSGYAQWYNLGLIRVHILKPYQP